MAIVNQSLADRYWPGEDPLGRSLTVHRSVQGRADFGEPVRARVIGVAGDVRHLGLEQPVSAEVYLPYVVNPPTWIQLVVRPRGAPGRLVPMLRERIRAIEPLLPLADAFGTIEDRLARGRAPRVFLARVISTFAMVALLLAAVGVWGVTAYTVARRLHEIGVRIALGARASRLPFTVVAATLPVVGTALVLGFAAALGVGRIMRSQLFGVSAVDPVALTTAAVTLLGAALLATYLPARKAAKIDPAAVLREE